MEDKMNVTAQMYNGILQAIKQMIEEGCTNEEVIRFIDTLLKAKS